MVVETVEFRVRGTRRSHVLRYVYSTSCMIVRQLPVSKQSECMLRLVCRSDGQRLLDGLVAHGHRKLGNQVLAVFCYRQCLFVGFERLLTL